MKANVMHFPAFSDRLRPFIIGTALWVLLFTGLLWLLSSVADWVLAVLKAAR